MWRLATISDATRRRCLFGEDYGQIFECMLGSMFLSWVQCLPAPPGVQEHTERTGELEREYLRRHPKRDVDPARTRAGARDR
jgi:hypothetical protein